MNTKNVLHSDFIVNRVSKNGPVRAEAAGIVFWNQGNTECFIDSNFRLAASKLNAATGLLEGGEAYIVEDPTGRMLVHTFQVTFTPNSNPPDTVAYNNLTVQMTVHLDARQDV